MMPGLNGIETCRKIKNIPELAGIPVIMVTGRTSTVDTVEGLVAGASDYVSKPVDPAEIVARVNAQLRASA